MTQVSTKPKTQTKARIKRLARELHFGISLERTLEEIVAKADPTASSAMIDKALEAAVCNTAEMIAIYERYLRGERLLGEKLKRLREQRPRPTLRMIGGGKT